MNCPTCNHNPHDAGQCKKCNCGEGEICSSRHWEGVYTREGLRRDGWADYRWVQESNKSFRFGKVPLKLDKTKGKR